MSKTGFFLGGVVGAIVGSAITYILCKRTMDEKVASESKEIIDQYNLLCDIARERADISKKDNENGVVETHEQSKTPIEQNSTYISHVKKYAASSDEDEEETNEFDTEVPWIKSIEPYSLGDDPSYDILTWHQCADGVVLDSNGDIVGKHMINDMVGESYLDHLGDFDRDYICMRNDEKDTYVEIVIEDDDSDDVEKRIRRENGEDVDDV